MMSTSTTLGNRRPVSARVGAGGDRDLYGRRARPHEAEYAKEHGGTWKDDGGNKTP
jgi:hypothetical protein